jgi:hypothetical protein
MRVCARAPGPRPVDVTLSPKKDLQRRQRRWAERAGVAHDARGYVRDVDSNLRLPLSDAARVAFARGSELAPRPTRPARIAALHSSAALVANVFDYWCTVDAAPLAAALGGAREPAAVTFEEPFPTGVEGDPPLVDVLVRYSSGSVLAIESKFCEWLTRRPRNQAAFKPKYFPPARELWIEHGLPRCQCLVDELRSGTRRFKHLHAAQLLKHALGLAHSGTAGAAVRYLYYDWPGRHGAGHRDELARFAELVGSEIGFASLTYQQLFAALRREPGVDASYLDYLRSRYFADVS